MEDFDSLILTFQFDDERLKQILTLEQDYNLLKDIGKLETMQEDIMSLCIAIGVEEARRSKGKYAESLGNKVVGAISAMLLGILEKLRMDKYVKRYDLLEEKLLRCTETIMAIEGAELCRQTTSMMGSICPTKDSHKEYNTLFCKIIMLFIKKADYELIINRSVRDAREYYGLASMAYRIIIELPTDTRNFWEINSANDIYWGLCIDRSSPVSLAAASEAGVKEMELKLF